MPQGHQCQICKHLRGVSGDDWTCAAFPKGIPTEIITGVVSHETKIGDEPFVFERVGRTFEDANIARAEARLARIQGDSDGGDDS